MDGTEAETTPLADAVRESGLSQGRIARKADLAESQFSRYVRGENWPRREIQLRIARTLTRAGVETTAEKLWPVGGTDA